MHKPSFYSIYVATKDIPRTLLIDLGSEYEIVCDSRHGWSLWYRKGIHAHHVACEFPDTHENGLRIDYDGNILVDSLQDHITEHTDVAMATKNLNKE